MTNKKIEVKLISPERYFSRCYHDFMDSKLLNGEEKIIFLALKRFLDVKSDSGDIFPSIGTIQEMTGWGNKKIIKYINSLIKKGIVKKIRQGLSKPNLYTLADYPAIWACNKIEDIKTIIDNDGMKPLSAEEHIQALEKMGYIVEVTKAKEPVSIPAKVTETSPQNQKTYINTNVLLPKSQDPTAKERYTREQIVNYFEFDILLNDYPDDTDLIDAAIDTLYDVLSTDKLVIKINGQSKPASAVIGRLMKLNKDSIMFTIKKVTEQKNTIKNLKQYLITALYSAPAEYALHIQNMYSTNT